MSFPIQNNLQWLRLLLATQVLVEHAAVEMGQWTPPVLANFPGVPAFFFVSGFLIYSAYCHSPGVQYCRNRLLRLFPALLFVALGGAAVALYAHGVGDLARHPLTYASWISAQVTLGQAYNPGHFRDVGNGVINGSLWTITTEILFYLAVPAIVALERRVRFLVPMLVSASFALYALGPSLWQQPIYRDKTIYDILALTPVVWGWMFGLGILAVQHFGSFRKYIGPVAILAVLVIPMMWSGQGLVWGASGNRLGLAYFLVYAALILGFAFATRYVPLRMDLSYGIYVWHMPIINALLVSVALAHSFVLALGLTVMMAAVSWFLVEEPALRLKKTSLLAANGKEAA